MRMHLQLHAPLLLLAVAATSGHAQDAPANYPLRIHVLAIDSTYPTPRLQPNWCSGSVPAMGGDPGGASADSGGSPCGGGSGMTTFGGDDDFSGTGRGDLVTLAAAAAPGATQAFTFSYDGCNRMRVPPGFTGLPARWKKPGKLEVLIPTDAIGTQTTRKCTLKAKVYEYVFLRMKGGVILKVSQDAYASKPSLRRFLSGGVETLQTRVPATVSIKQLSTGLPEQTP